MRCPESPDILLPDGTAAVPGPDPPFPESRKPRLPAICAARAPPSLRRWPVLHFGMEVGPEKKNVPGTSASANMHSANKSAYISVDLETDRHGKIIAYGAVRSDTGQSQCHNGRNISNALDRLDEFAEGASFILGHNLAKFDLPLLRATRPDLRLLRLPYVDTLRLSPLAFPKHPYHSLVKHYQDGGLKQGKVNDPELDARLAMEVFDDQRMALSEADPDLLTAWHWLCTPEPEGSDCALSGCFSQLRKATRPSDDEARAAIARRLRGAACKTHGLEVQTEADQLRWNLSFALAWLSVSGENSVIPPWVLYQFPKVGTLVRRLRDTACGDPDCGWCSEYQDARKELKRWFGYPDFRPEPTCDDGKPMQQAIVEGSMACQHVLGILPTGSGKSLCYQIPALSRYYKTGALTVVISPLVALMADQVAGMEEHGISCCVTVNGLLSMPERAAAIERVRLGEARDTTDLSRTATLSFSGPIARPAPDWCLGSRRSALPVTMGP